LAAPLLLLDPLIFCSRTLQRSHTKALLER